MSDKEALLEEISDICGAPVKKAEPLFMHTTFKIGGPAEFFTQPRDEKALGELILFARRKNIPFTVLGGGSNVLINDGGVKGIIACLKSDHFKQIQAQGQDILARAGASLGQLCAKAAANGLSGLEPLAGIPGTIGGALIGNAGSRTGNGWISIGDFAQSVTVFDGDANRRVLAGAEMGFGYRKSGLQGFVIVEASFKLKKADPREVKDRTQQYFDKKKAAQDMGLASAGCVFKNPQNSPKSSGQLIDECGLKGARLNGAQVSEKHANFIVNLGKASADDVLELMRLMKAKVRERHGIELEEEIRII